MPNDGKKPKFYRKQYLVAKKFQLRYVGQILLLMFLTAILCSYVAYYNSIMLLGEKLANVYPQGRLIAIIRTVNFRMMMSVVLIMPLVAILGIYLSHKIAGPIYRMERYLGSMAEGDLSVPLTLRKGDELIPLADGINKVGQDLKITIAAQKTSLDKALSDIESIKKSGGGRAGEIASLEKELRAMDAAIAKYKLERPPRPSA